jgi:hypothetical protein
MGEAEAFVYYGIVTHRCHLNLSAILISRRRGEIHWLLWRTGAFKTDKELGIDEIFEKRI